MVRVTIKRFLDVLVLGQNLSYTSINHRTNQRSIALIAHHAPPPTTMYSNAADFHMTSDAARSYHASRRTGSHDAPEGPKALPANGLTGRGLGAEMRGLVCIQSLYVRV